MNGSCDAVTNVSCDMSPAFIKGVGKHLHNASITFDKFHILKVINKGVDEVRRQEAKNNPLLKGTRYIFLKNDKNLTKKQRATKQELSLSRLSLKSVRAMNIRESFRQLYSLKNIEEFTAEGCWNNQSISLKLCCFAKKTFSSSLRRTTKSYADLFNTLCRSKKVVFLGNTQQTPANG